MSHDRRVHPEAALSWSAPTGCGAVMRRDPPELEPSVLPQLQATDDPLEKGFIILGSVARQIAKMRTWEELCAPPSEGDPKR